MYSYTRVYRQHYEASFPKGKGRVEMEVGVEQCQYWEKENSRPGCIAWTSGIQPGVREDILGGT